MKRKKSYLLIYVFLILYILGKIDCFHKPQTTNSAPLTSAKYVECNSILLPNLCSRHSSLGQFGDSFLKFYIVLSTGPRLLWSTFETYCFSSIRIWKSKLSSLWVNRNFIHCICYLHGHIHMCTSPLLGDSEQDSDTSQERCINICH